MGRRSRKRADGPVRTETPAPVSPPARPGRLDRFLEKADQRPKPPWHPVPLVELAVLVGIVLLVVGMLNNETSRGRLAIVFGLALASLAGLDTAAREHFAGYRSHSTLLAALPAVVTVVACAVAGLPWAAMVAAAVAVFGICWWAARNAFRRRAGVAFKV